MNHNIQPLLNKIYKRAVSAKGIYIYDEDGKAYLDGSSGPVACSIGHSHEKLLPFIKEQLDRLQYVYRSQFGSFEAEQLADKLYQLSPNRQYSHTFFVSSGSEAIETAMKIAIQYWQEKGYPEKNQFITRQKSYHGITMGALSITGHKLRRKSFEQSLLPYPRKLTMDLESDRLEKHLEEIEKVIHEFKAERIAALVLEPVIGAAGTAMVPPDGYFQNIRKLCDKHNILLITDEVMTGLGRTGKWFATEHWETTADLVTIGKSLGAGYAPIAAVLTTDQILEPIKSGSGSILSGHTYSGHPLSCATGLRILEIIEEDNLIENVQKMGTVILNNLNELKKKYGFIEKVRGKGLLLGVELSTTHPGLQTRIIDRCYKNGLLVYPSVGGPGGIDENGILIAPPYIITEQEVGLMMDILDQSFNQISKNI